MDPLVPSSYEVPDFKKFPPKDIGYLLGRLEYTSAGSPYGANFLVCFKIFVTRAKGMRVCQKVDRILRQIKVRF